MKRNPILFILLAILIAQPLLSVGFGPSATTTAVQPEDVIVPAQGTRLDPGDHTDHVPILIDGTGDFAAQGWPGAGTSGDPYVISGLNITYGIGIACIAIFNTDAYFVVRDCYIGQNSAINGVHLENTTHATLEYVTISSPSHAIHGMNANNTAFAHLDVAASGLSKYALDFWNSSFCTLESSMLVSVDHRSVVLTNCDTFTMSGNTMSPVNHKYAVHALNSPYFSSTNDVITDGHSMRIESSNHSVVSGLTINGQFGVIFVTSFFCSVFDSDITAYTYDGVYTDSGGSITASGNTIEANRYGLYASYTNETSFAVNTIEDISNTGVYLQYSHHSEVLTNTITTIAVDGIYAYYCDDLQIEGNTITDALDQGMYIVESDDGFLTDNIVTGTDSDGVLFGDCNNWSVSENEISECGNIGLGVSGGAFFDVWDNQISSTDDIGLYVNTHGMFEAWENTMTETDGGIYVTSSDETYIRDNDVYSSTDYGMYIQNSVNHSIDDNRFYDCFSFGIYLDNCDTSSFSGNQIFAGPSYGIYSADSSYNTFSSNFLAECGFFGESGVNIDDMNHTFSGNTVNGLPVFYAIDEIVGSIDGDLYGQIILVACNDTAISGGTFEKATAPIMVAQGYNVSIEDATMYDNVYGIVFDYSNNNSVSNTMIDTCHTGIFMRENDFSSILNTNLRNCEFYGVRTYNVFYTTIRDTTFENIGAAGFYTDTYALNLTVVDSSFYNMSNSGINLDGNSDYFNITDNLFEHCDYAIWMDDTSTDYGVIIGNEIYYSTNVGIYFTEADYANIQNNTILWSGTHALNVSGNAWIQAGWQICYNTFGLSGTNNAFDGRAANVWDDEVDTGNWWSDYSGTGTYSIPGDGAVDNYPMRFLPTEPIMNELMDVSYAEGTTGNELSWEPYDNYLKDYLVTIDGSFWVQDAVSAIENPEITVNIDELSYGVYTLVITVYDIDMNSVSDTVIITVYDDIDPIINTPVNFEIFLGIAGNQIVWDADDLNP
ncbi:MAG: right-handed parallel beta-helix repeat-containing protein, partial [Candidatus Thorarchaeota archaeon]